MTLSLTPQTLFWVFAFGLQITNIARSQASVCRRPDFDETLISITKNQSIYDVYDVIELSCLGVAVTQTGPSRFTCQPSMLWRPAGFSSECNTSSCTTLVDCLGPCSLSTLDDDVGFDGETVENEGDMLVRDGTSVMFRCNGVLDGNIVLTCSDTNWLGTIPTCQAECSLNDLVGYQVANNAIDTSKQHEETFSYQCGSESINVTCDDGTWMSDTECTLPTTSLPRVTTTTVVTTVKPTTTEQTTVAVTSTRVSTTKVSTPQTSTETTTAETTTAVEPTTSKTAVSTTTTTKPTEVMNTTETIQVPTSNTTTEMLTTTEEADVPTTTDETVVSTGETVKENSTLVTLLSPDLTTEQNTTITTISSVVNASMNSTSSVETPDSTITTAVPTTKSPCSYCNFTFEYCGEDDTCVCRPGSFRQNDECIRSRTFYTTMTISQYNGGNASLSMINDTDEEVLTKEIISLINLIFSQQSDYIGCIVFRLTSGSIIADIVTYFNTSTTLNATEVNDVIIDGFEAQNQPTIVIVPETTITRAAFDECELALDDCHELAECTDTAEYFNCSCPENTTDQLEGGLDGRLCAPRPTVPEADMSTSESTSESLISTTVTMPVDRSFIIVLAVLITVIVIFLLLACCLAFINSISIRSRSGFNLTAKERQASIEVLDMAEKNEHPTDGKPFKMEITEDDELPISTTVEAVQVLRESVVNPVYVDAGSDVEAPHEMKSFSTSGQTSNTQDVSMVGPTYAEPDAIDDKTNDKIPADGGDLSVESPNSSDLNDKGNDTATGEMDVIYAQPLPKSERPPSQKETSKKEEEPTGDRNSVGLGELASTMANFPSSGARKLSAMFEEEATVL